jgi:hypothetical protein
MDCRKSLELARNIIIQNYSKLSREIILDKERPVLKIVFNFEIVLYIRYNDFGEYSYSVIFTPNPDDQMRFDNYDDRWGCEYKTPSFSYERFEFNNRESYVRRTKSRHSNTTKNDSKL